MIDIIHFLYYSTLYWFIAAATRNQGCWWFYSHRGVRDDTIANSWSREKENEAFDLTADFVWFRFFLIIRSELDQVWMLG
jgi:hypothetical protein